jgi:MraZ protein
MFLSSFESVVDVKKRVSVPASFRKALSGEEAVFLWPSIDKGCLEGGGAELVRQFQRAIARLRPLDPRREALSFAIFGRGRHCRFDDGGRIVLEGDLLSHAGILDRARFVGLGDRFQIWTPERHHPRSDELLRMALDSGDLLEPFGEPLEGAG